MLETEHNLSKVIKAFGCSDLTMNVTLRQLRAFLAGARSASFSEAAGKVNLSQPGYSLVIRQLEEEMGLKLFDRTTRSMALTPEGSEFAIRIERVLDELDDACRDIEDVRLLRRGRVHLAVLPSVASSIVPAILQSLKVKHPHIDVTLTESLAEPLIESVLSGEADFGFSTNLGIESDLQYTPLLEDRLVCVFPASHALAARSVLAWSDIEQERYVRFSDKSSINYYVRESTARVGIQLKAVHEVSYVSTAVSLVRSMMGYSILPQLALSGVDLEGVSLIPLNDPLAFRSLGTITPNRRTRGPAALAVLNLFQRECKAIAERIGPRTTPHAATQDGAAAGEDLPAKA